MLCTFNCYYIAVYIAIFNLIIIATISEETFLISMEIFLQIYY